MEKAHEYQKSIYMCFIDYKKAFDCVDQDKLWRALHDLGVPTHLVKLLQSLCPNQEATVQTSYGDTGWFKIEKGV
ncbi:hypothetical protein JGG43_23775 [Salmonella enterica subsp. enterica serovar Typhimurium]|nr:hypothetical protein [Salmonella enterica subsp. enterica serovar Typhimurium]